MQTIEPPLSYSLAPFVRTRSIFVHVPKASGVSVSRSLYGGLGGGHMYVSEYQLAFPAADFYDYFKFAFVRNPWDRLFSAYHFLKSGGMLAVDRSWAEQRLARFATFEAFVLEGLHRRDVRSHIHFVPQSAFLRSFDGSHFPIDFVGFFENLEADFASIGMRLGRPDRLAHLNRTQGAPRDYRGAFTPPMVEAVARVYRQDIALLGYDFDGASLPRQLALRDEGRLLRR